jgi:hypothetical protein
VGLFSRVRGRDPRRDRRFFAGDRALGLAFAFIPIVYIRFLFLKLYFWGTPTVRKGYAGLCVMHNGFMDIMGTDYGATPR